MQIDSLKKQLVGQRLSAARSRAAIDRAISSNSAAVMEHARKIRTQGILRAGSELVVHKVNTTGRSSHKQHHHGRGVLKLHVRGTTVKGSGRYQSLGPRCRLLMGFSKEVATKALARKHDCHANTVRTNRAAVAGSIYQEQLQWLTDLLTLSGEVKPLVCCVTRTVG